MSKKRKILDFKYKIQSMKSNIFDTLIAEKFTGDEGKKNLNVAKDLIKNILATTKGLGFNNDEIYSKFDFNKATICTGLKDGKTIATEQKKFIKAVGDFILAEHSDRYLFNTVTIKFEPIKLPYKKQFEIGTYYGYFKKEDDNKTPFHFILLVEKNRGITLYTSNSICKGVIEEFSDSYSAVLTEIDGEKRQVFLIGNNSRIEEKFFIGTWHSEDDKKVISSLCFAVYFKHSKYDTIEKIKKDVPNETKELIEKMPTFVADFFSEQTKKHIITQSSVYVPRK